MSEFSYSINKSSKKFRLRTALIVPFVLQIFAAVGLIEYLSFRNGQKAINDLASQLRSEVTARVHDRVQTYVEVPQLINQFNAHAVEMGLLDFQDIKQAELYFWRQTQTYESIGNVGFANAQGQSTRVGWVNRLSASEQPQIAEQLTPGGGNLQYYDIDDNGNRIKLAKTVPNYDARNRPYYTSAIKKGQPTWSEVYINKGYNLLQIKASQPFYDRNGRLLGVLACELGLKQIGQFLQTLKIGRSGQVFIIEPSGELVAASVSNQALLVENSQGSKRVQALESENVLMRSSAAFLKEHFNNLQNIQQNYQLEFSLEGKRQFLQVSPFSDKYGLNWVIVVAVPESDFMGQINANTQTTIVLCFITLLIMIVIGILTSRWITSPILHITKASEEIASGDLNQNITTQGIIELEKLADSFNRMALQLRESFAELELLKDSFARFFPSEYLKFLDKDSVMQIQLGDHVSKEMAMMFSDIRSFTTLSESMTPQESFDFINTYLQQVSPEIYKHNGFIVKYLGDGVMAAFPESVDDAVQAGLAQFYKIQKYNHERAKQGLLPIKIGMGIHIGHMMVGMIGETNRIQGDALSDIVNLTSRLEGLTKFYGVSLLISGKILDQLSNSEQYQVRFLDRVIVKGKSEAVAVYEVLDAEVEAVKILKLQTLSEFNRGVKNYANGELTKAKADFEEVLAVNSLDKTAELYLERIHQLMKEGVPENWNGVWVFAQK